MNTFKISALLSLLLASAAVTAQTQETGKTRQQVYQELLQAQHDGLIPTSKLHYPPSAEQIARNRELHQLTRKTAKGASEPDTHTAP